MPATSWHWRRSSAFSPTIERYAIQDAGRALVDLKAGRIDGAAVLVPMIRLGTSGFSYDDWIGPVYPPELPRWQWLGHYATLFDTVEYQRHLLPPRRPQDGFRLGAAHAGWLPLHGQGSRQPDA